jgi:phosphoglycerate dehydrogenase-like enzyme
VTCPPHSVQFLDNDHVLGLVRAVLAGPGAQSTATIRSFFAPEVVDPDPVLALGARPRCARPVLGPLPAHYGQERAPDPDTTVLVLRRGRVTAQLLDGLPRLGLIVRLGTRTDAIDTAAVRERGIRLHRVRRRSLEWTAEHALLLMMAVGKKLPLADRLARLPAAAPSAGRVGYNWPGLTGLWGLSGRTLLVVGAGEVGELVAARAAALGMHVRTTSGRSVTGLDAADVVSLHVPGVAATRGLADARFLAAMRPGAVLVNTSRGSVLDEEAAYAALVSGHLGGLGLDVHAHEPRPAGDRLATLDSVVMTPHIAAGSRTSVLPEVADLLDAVGEFLERG